MNINHNNRLQIVRHINALNADVTLPVLIADKKMRILSAKYVQEGAISASGTNYLELQLKKNDVAVESAVDTQAGVAARTPIALEVGVMEELPSLAGLVLEKEDYLALDVNEEGTFAQGTDAILTLDVEVMGN